MKKILFIFLTLFISSRVFSQTTPATTPPANPQQMNTNTVYQDALTKKYYTYNGSVFLWRQLVDSIQAARMIANAGFGNGTVTSITPGLGFTSHTPITTNGILNVDTLFFQSIFARLNGGNALSGNQILNGNIIFPADGNGLTFPSSSISTNIQALEFNTGQIDGFKFKYFNDDILDLASTGHGANISYAKFSTNLSWKPTGTQQFYNPGTSRFVVQIFDPTAGADKGLADTISGVAARALLGVSSKAHGDSLISAISTRIYYSSPSSGNTIANSVLQNATIINVSRGGFTYYPTVSTSPAGSFYYNDPTAGSVKFQDNFNSGGEPVLIAYRYSTATIGGVTAAIKQYGTASAITYPLSSSFIYVVSDETKGNIPYMYYAPQGTTSFNQLQAIATTLNNF